MGDILVRVSVEGRLASSRTEVECLVVMCGRKLGLLLVHHHSTHRVSLHCFTSVIVAA